MPVGKDRVCLTCFKIIRWNVDHSVLVEIIKTGKLFDCWSKDVKRFYKNEITWEELLKSDEERIASDVPDFIL